LCNFNAIFNKLKFAHTIWLGAYLKATRKIFDRVNCDRM
jgi:hypothetical protein